MKRRSIIALLLALAMCLSLLAACGGNSGQDTPEPPTDAPDSSGSREEEPQTPEPEPTAEASTQEEPTTEEPTEPETEPEPAVPAEMTYTFDVDTGTLTCSGGGEVVLDDWLHVVMNALFETDDYLAKAEVKKVVVEQGVTSLGKRVFFNCKNLTEAVLPDTLISIGQDAFYSTALTGIVIPESVTDLAAGSYGVFGGCRNLASVSLPSGLTEIPASLFYGCESLTSIEIPTGVTRIGYSAFQETGLTELVIPEGVTAIESQFITSTSIASITLPASLTEWESTTCTCGSASLTDITILCEATMDNVESLVGVLLYRHMTIHAPAGSVIEGYVNRQIQTGNATCTFEPIE